MNDRALSRRSVLSLLGSAIVVAPVAARAGATGSIELPEGATDGAPDAAHGGNAASAQAIVAPLRVGARVVGCRVEQIGAIALGAISMKLTDEAGRTFGLEVCARDAQVTAPGQTRHHQVFVVNEGDGDVPTHEQHGLAAMTVAELVASNEGDAPAEGMLTLVERLDRHGGSITRPA